MLCEIEVAKREGGQRVKRMWIVIVVVTFVVLCEEGVLEKVQT